MGTAIADREGRPLIPGTPSSAAEWVSELRELNTSKHIWSTLQGFAHAAKVTADALTTASDAPALYLLELTTRDASTGHLRITSFEERERDAAYAMYSEREKATLGNSSEQVVLVSVARLKDLKAAYPNFYLDASAFISALDYELSVRPDIYN